MMAAHVVSQIEVPSIQKIDREKICPLLLRIFCSSGRHNSSSDYDRGSTPGNELQVYTWLDCTLRELSSLIKDVNPDARKPGTEYKFAVVTPHPRNPRFVLNDIGTVINGDQGGDDNKTLSQCNFAVGDYIDVAIVPPGFNHHYRNGTERRFTSGDRRRESYDRPMRRYVPTSFRD